MKTSDSFSAIVITADGAIVDGIYPLGATQE
jgi:hypothetical protein